MSLFLDYATRGRTRWWLYPLATAAALVLAVIAFVVVYVALAFARLVPPDLAADLTSPARHPVVFYIATGATFGVVLLGFILAIWLIHNKTPGDIIGRWSWRLTLLGAGIWLVVQVVGVGIDYAIAPSGFRLTLSPATGPLAAAAVLGLGVQTFAEEFVFRGYATQALLLATRRPWVAAVLSGLLFGSLHIPNGWPQAANAVFFGVVTAMIAIRTGGLAFTFGLHVVNNIFGAVAVVSSADVFKGSPGLFTQTAPQLMTWWDVGLGLVALVGVFWFIHRLPAAEADAPGEAFG